MQFGSLPNSLYSQFIPEPDQIALNQIKETSEKLKKTYNINPIGYGMDGKFEYLEISFEAFRNLPKKQARELLINCVEEFMNDINSNEKLRPHLKEYPFTLKNVGIVFYISDSTGKDFYDPNLCVAGCTKNGLRFKTNDPNQKYKYKETTEETHEEALDLVKKQKQLAQKSKDE